MKKSGASTYRPFVTVLMSVYNGERWLAESIQSVLQQTYTSFEFIILNDGSTDQSLDIIIEFASLDSRIRVLNKSNSGLADSLNYGIKQAKGEWIARIDADDAYLPEKLKRQLDFISLNSDVVLVGTGLILVDENGHRGKIHQYPSNHHELVHRLSHAAPFFAHSSVVFSSSIVRRLNGYRTRIHRSQDLDLWLRMAAKGGIACLSEPLVLVRKHDDQISHDEGGQRSMIDAHVAMTSYWIRNMTKSDPVEIDSDRDFEIFRSWISNELRNFEFFEQKSFFERLKYDFMSADSGISKARIILVSVLHHPLYAISGFLARCRGSQIPIKLARSWLARR